MIMDKSEAMEKARLVEQGVLPVGSAIIPLTGPGSLTDPGGDGFNFEGHLQRQLDFSVRTFGPGFRPKGIVDHIKKELREIEAKPDDLSEWIDVVILGLDGALKSGHSPAEVVDALVAKQTRNEARQWPDWRTADPDKAIEHVRPKPPAEARAAELFRWTKVALARHYKVIANWIGGEEPVTWSRDELVNAIVEIEYPPSRSGS